MALFLRLHLTKSIITNRINHHHYNRQLLSRRLRHNNNINYINNNTIRIRPSSLIPTSSSLTTKSLGLTTVTTQRTKTTTTSSPPNDYINNTSSTPTCNKKSTTPLPSHANIIIIGGGIIGSSIAYHLSQRGIHDILLLERNKLTSGTTWHAAGLINTFGSLSSTSTEIRQYTKELYATILPGETEAATGFLPVGFIELATTRERWEYYRRVAAFNRYCGVDVVELSAGEVKEKFPLVDVTDVVAGFWVPDDGRANPTDVTMALIKGAKKGGGVRVCEGVGVERVEMRDDGRGGKVVTGVVLEGDGKEEVVVKTETVVNCAGMWARELGERDGVCIPNQAAEHYYILTEPIPSISPHWPVIEDPTKHVYIRPEGGGLMLGLFEPHGATPWNVSSPIPPSFCFDEIDPDWDRMLPFVEAALSRLEPSVRESVGIKTLFCGPESFTPDGNPIVGEVGGVRGYYVAAGMNSLGILSAGGIGKLMAEWIDPTTSQTPSSLDVTPLNITRFHKNQSNPTYRRQRTPETLGNTYKIHYPNKSPTTCRGGKCSVLHNKLLDKHAVFKDVSGWEAPSYFGTGERREEALSFGRSGVDWFDYWREEHLACRENVALFDMSFMSKFLVQGPHAGLFLDYLSTAKVDTPNPGTITYTQWLNHAGFLEADLTITKLHHEKYLVVATDTMHNHVLSHMNRHLSSFNSSSSGSGGGGVIITDATGAYAQINIQGPQSRRLLSRLTTVDVSNDAFPFRRAMEIDIGIARCWCMRITYVGELGYELFIPVEHAAYIYDEIMTAADRVVVPGKEKEEREDGGDKLLLLRHAGLKALGSLRMEKGYRDYGHDIDNTDSLLDAGLSFTCDFETKDDFIGRDIVLQQKQDMKANGGLSKRMAQVLVKNPLPMLHHGEVLWKDGERVSDVRSGSYGHLLGGAVGLSMVENKDGIVNKKWLTNGTWEVEIGKEFYPVELSLVPFYDPKSARVKV